MSVSTRVVFVGGIAQLEQPIKVNAIGRRGRPLTAETLANLNRGKPFVITWNAMTGKANLQFGGSPIYEHQTMTFVELQEIVSSSNPLRQFNKMFTGKGHATRRI